ncbi:MAG: glycosyltransferase [Candidatus Levyibacteriota bacterium]
MKNKIKNSTNKNRPLVSVVMPVYNAEKYVKSAIESILSQSYKNLELIIIDDLSIDNSWKILKGYKKRYPGKIQIERTSKNLNCGGDACANLAIEKAKGKYIARMDADDISLPNRIEKQVSFMEKNKNVFLVGSSAFVIDKNGNIIGEKNEPSSSSEIYSGYATFHPIIHPSAMIRRVVNGKKFFYQIKYSANNDYFTFFGLLCEGFTLANLPEKLVLYRIHDTNDTFVKMKEKFMNTLKIRLEMFWHHSYKPTIKDFAISAVQAIIILSLPESMSKRIYLLSKGIIKLKFPGTSIADKSPALYTS